MNTEKDLSKLWTIGFDTIKELETERGILASGKEEIFGCIFGRDSLITCLNLLNAYKKTKDEYLLNLAKKILSNLSDLQGEQINIESGEEPGKMIHEYRPDNHEHLTKHLNNPWFVYADNSMKNYDTVDATPLFLLAMHEYLKVSENAMFIELKIGNICAALEWILHYGDSNRDGLIDYYFNSERKFGGLKAQSWMDSTESLFHEDGEEVAYPIAPVEVQAYTYAALNSWGEYFKGQDDKYAARLLENADNLKSIFNQTFVIQEGNEFILASAIDGKGKPVKVARSSMGHCLWAAVEGEDGKMNCILDEEYITPLKERLLQPDLYESKAGMRTLSKKSKNYNPNSYHNGSIWPHDTSIIISGLENFGYKDEANEIRNSLVQAFEHFQTPLELFVFDGEYKEYISDHGQTACRKQAWSAASLLNIAK